MSRLVPAELRRFRVQTADDLLHALVRKVEAMSDTATATATEASSGPLPRVRLLIGARELAGIPVRIEQRQQEPWLVLYQPEGDPRGNDCVAFVPVKTIGAVVVEESPAHLDVLLGRTAAGKPQARITQADAPSRISVERGAIRARDELRAAGWEGVEVHVDWGGHQDDPDTRFRAQAGLSSLVTTLGALFKTRGGASVKDVLGEARQLVVGIEPSSDVDARREGSVLRAVIGTDADLGSLDEAFVRAMTRGKE